MAVNIIPPSYAVIHLNQGVCLNEPIICIYFSACMGKVTTVAPLGWFEVRLNAVSMLFSDNNHLITETSWPQVLKLAMWQKSRETPSPFVYRVMGCVCMCVIMIVTK